MRENAGAADVILSEEEEKMLDKALGTIPMSEVFGGTALSGKSAWEGGKK